MTELAMTWIAIAALVFLIYAAVAAVATTDLLDDPRDRPQVFFGDRLPTAVMSSALLTASGGCAYGLALLS